MRGNQGWGYLGLKNTTKIKICDLVSLPPVTAFCYAAVSVSLSRLLKGYKSLRSIFRLEVQN